MRVTRPSRSSPRSVWVSIAVTGATGHLGRLAVESLLRTGVPAAEIVATGRDVEKLADLAARGVTVRVASYDDPAALEAAFAGVDKLLFVSGNEVGRRVPQHRAVVEAARAAGVRLVAYTSAPHADTSGMILADDHLATERALIDSGLPYVILRNGWYVENYDLKNALDRGLFGAAGAGRISVATRADLAAAAAAVLTTDGHENRVYELGGEAVTLTELAAEASRQSGRAVSYTDLPPQQYIELLVGAGVPQAFAEVLADSDQAAARGALFVDPKDLENLLGRPATPLADAVRTVLG